MTTSEKSTYGILDVASYFLSKESMTNKKLQKLTYYAEAWHQALIGGSLVNDSEFQAWVHGPVSPALYGAYKDHGWNEISKMEEPIVTFDETTAELLDSVWDTYGDQDGNSLEALTHSEPPWRNARMGYADNENSKVPIDAEDMKKYYSSIYIGD